MSELFEAARGLPAGERERWVRSNCVDERVSTEVLALLRVYEEDPTFLERPLPATVAGAALRAVATPSIEGRHIGPYRLVREVGRGGMGVVYEAEHIHAEFSRRVAIKLVPSGWSATSLVARFRYERRVLARLDHPGITRLLDVGTTDEGTPYFVMEYVDGLPIDRWCLAHALTVRERVELLLRVCEAVEHAHRNLVVHRDLKASNILVTGDGQPKLLDFGIAKFLTEEAESSRGRTATGQGAFTPAYASPEQMRGEGVTTACDIYSLGVLLYVLLAERLPYDVSDRSPLEVMRAVCDADPAAPSAVAPAGARRAILGDLDNVVLLALRKDPRERYRSVHAMADDLVAWLNGRPVSASPATLWYRARKLVARRKAQAIAAAAVVAALLAGGATTAWQAYLTRLERDKAEARFREVRQFSRSLLFELHDSIRGLPGSTPSRQLLLSRALQFLDGLAKDAGDDQPLKLELADGYRKLGQVQGTSYTANVGDTEGAIASFHKATRLGEDVLAQQPRSTDAAILLGGVYGDLGGALLRRGDVEQAEQAFRRNLALVEQLERRSARDPVVQSSLVSSYRDLAFFRQQRSDLAQAKTLFEKAIDLYETLPAELQAVADTIGTVSGALKRLGAILLVEGSLDLAEERYRRALALDEQLVARDPQDPAHRFNLTYALNDLGLIAGKRGDMAGAEALFARALGIRLQALAADPRDVRVMAGVANDRQYLGSLYLEQKRIDEAIASLREDARLRADIVAIEGPLPPNTHARAVGLVYLAEALLDKVEADPAGPRATAAVVEARRLVSQAGPAARARPSGSFVPEPDFVANFERQAARLRRLEGR